MYRKYVFFHYSSEFQIKSRFILIHTFLWKTFKNLKLFKNSENNGHWQNCGLNNTNFITINIIPLIIFPNKLGSPNINSNKNNIIKVMKL